VSSKQSEATVYCSAGNRKSSSQVATFNWSIDLHFARLLAALAAVALAGLLPAQDCSICMCYRVAVGLTSGRRPINILTGYAMVLLRLAGFYPAAILPLIIVLTITSVETVSHKPACCQHILMMI
jgi:hypothetical protein